MGRLCASVLLLAVGACGDNGDGRDFDPYVPPDILGGESIATPRLEPAVCGVSSWSRTAGIDPISQVTAVARPGGGATVLEAPLAGGTLIGVQLNKRMGLESGNVSKLVNDAAYTSATISYIQDRPVTASLADGALFLHMYDTDLTSPQLIAKLPGTALSEPSFFANGTDFVMPVGTADGLWMYRFQDSLEPIDQIHISTTKPVNYVTSAKMGNELLTAFSTDGECHIAYSTASKLIAETVAPVACANPRISVDETKNDAVLLFDVADGVHMMPIHLTMFGGDAPLVRADTTAPRALFDGEYFWVSYLDGRGDLVVGVLDEDRHPITMSLGDTQPIDSAYSLVMIDGAPTIFSLEDTGYSMYRLCLNGKKTAW